MPSSWSRLANSMISRRRPWRWSPAARGREGVRQFFSSRTTSRLRFAPPDLRSLRRRPVMVSDQRLGLPHGQAARGNPMRELHLGAVSTARSARAWPCRSARRAASPAPAPPGSAAQQVGCRAARATIAWAACSCVKSNSRIQPLHTLCFFQRLRSSRWMFSISAIASAAVSGTGLTSTGLRQARPAAPRDAALPAMISYCPESTGRTRIGCMTPWALIESASSASAAGPCAYAAGICPAASGRPAAWWAAHSAPATALHRAVRPARARVPWPFDHGSPPCGGRARYQ